MSDDWHIKHRFSVVFEISCDINICTKLWSTLHFTISAPFHSSLCLLYHNFLNNPSHPVAESMFNKVFHHSPLYGSTFIWTSICLDRLPACLKRFPQTLHPKGSSPVWTLTCLIKSLFDAKCLPQNSQVLYLHETWRISMLGCTNMSPDNCPCTLLWTFDSETKIAMIYEIYYLLLTLVVCSRHSCVFHLVCNIFRQESQLFFRTF